MKRATRWRFNLQAELAREAAKIAAERKHRQSGRNKARWAKLRSTETGRELKERHLRDAARQRKCQGTPEHLARHGSRHRSRELALFLLSEGPRPVWSQLHPELWKYHIGIGSQIVEQFGVELFRGENE